VAVRLARVADGDPAARQAATLQPLRWTCALVNNMPDSAFEATERQYLGLLDAASGSEAVEVTLHSLAAVPRGERAAARIAERYSSVKKLWSSPPDLLIVTGSNPLESQIEDEPYWGELVELLTWGTQQVGSMLLSCLAAHAALTVFDGLSRERLSSKCTGVFPQRPDLDHPLAADLGPSIVLPHSRLNTVAVDAVIGAGYRVALRSDLVGWSVGTKDVGRSRVVVVQGHPEYDPSSLLREYHRDARRYLHLERDDLPCLPLDCVAPEDWDRLADLQCRIVGGERDPALIEGIPFDEMGERAPWPWRGVAIGLYTNWMAGVPDRSE
jgi:homoserine O-succinyltransferase/O-acetyltransferase